MKKIIKSIPTPNIDFKSLMLMHGFDGKIPSHYIINKRIPGIGATKNEILSPRHSIIIAPYTALIEVKKVGYGKLLAVQYGESDLDKSVETLLEYLNDKNITFKKIMTTPESFYKVKMALKTYNPNYNSDFFILIDECDVFVSDAIFRKNMLKFLPDFFSFSNLAMISATPHIPTDPRFEECGFSYLLFEPSFKLEHPLELIITNNINSSARDIIDYHNKTDKQPFFIFTNCKNTIAYLSTLPDFKDDYKIFCSQRLKDSFFLQREIDNVFATVDEQDYSKLNSLTGRYFSGVDILLPNGVKPNVIMISNVNEIPHSIIHPNFTAIQIFGRCRTGVNSITHITTLFKDRPHYNESHIREHIDKEIYHLTALRELKDKISINASKKLIADLMQKNKGFDMFNEDGSLNTYFRDNHLFSTLSENLYSDVDALVSEYKNGNFFKVKVNKVYKAFTDEDQLKLNSKRKTKDRAIEVFQQLHNLIEHYGMHYIGHDDNEFYKHLQLLNKEDPLVFEAYFLLGAERLARLKWKRSDIRLAVNLQKNKDVRNNVQMTDEVINSFYCGIKVYIDEIERKLNAIYKRYNFTDKRGNLVNAKGTDIEGYFDGKRYNGKVKINGVYRSYYILTAPKFRTSNDYKK